MAKATDRTILIVGAAGFIGRRLGPVLQRAGYPVRGLVRRADAPLPAGIDRVVADAGEPVACAAALRGIDTVFYLVHALDQPPAALAALERQTAAAFVAAADAAGVRRVIFLSGLGDPGQPLSPHLASRQAVADLLAGGRFRLTVLRAAIIIGAGGASYETIRFLVRTQPVLLAPRFLQARVQPIAVDDVIGYLAGCLADERTAGQSFDIGGPEVLTYQQLLERFARAVGDVNLFLPVPVLPTRLVAGLVGLCTRVRAPVVRALLEGLDNDVVCSEERIRELLPRRLLRLEEAVRRARGDDRQQAAGG